VRFDKWYQIQIVHKWLVLDHDSLWPFIPDHDSGWFGTRSEWKVCLVPDSDSGNQVHKYRMAKLVLKGWTHLEVKGYT
jgi:hypothetical protein